MRPSAHNIFILAGLALAATVLTACNMGEFDRSISAPPTDPVNASTDAETEEPLYNPFIDPNEDPLATFSVDVDTASYTLMRRSLTEGKLPDRNRIRVEEYINYFKYDYPEPTTEDVEPFSITLEAAPSYFGENLHMLRVGVKGESIPPSLRPPSNLVFLIDVSGSMQSADKIGFVKYSLKTLVDALRADDTIAIVTYAGEERVALPPTRLGDRTAVLNAIDNLTTGGGTNGAAGIERAYDLAKQNFNANGINRVILCTDGDFNVGITEDELVSYVEQRRGEGVFLSALGYGTDNLDDGFLEDLTNRGNGNYYFVDTHNEARRVLADALGGTMQVIASDVKVQVEFNPDVISRYRIVGYENRVLNDEDFADDKVDAGDIGSGHTVTAFLEFELKQQVKRGSGLQVEIEDAFAATQFIDVRVRYKRPGQARSDEVVKIVPLDSLQTTFDGATDDFRFAAAVTEFAEILRYSPHSSGARFEEVRSLAEAALGEQAANRSEFLDLVNMAANLWGVAGEDT